MLVNIIYVLLVEPPSSVANVKLYGVGLTEGNTNTDNKFFADLKTAGKIFVIITILKFIINFLILLMSLFKYGQSKRESFVAGSNHANV